MEIDEKDRKIGINTFKKSLKIFSYKKYFEKSLEIHQKNVLR